MPTLFASWTPNLTCMTRSPMNLPKAANGPIGCGSSFPNLKAWAIALRRNDTAIRDLDQAKRYLAHPLLGSRLRDDVRLRRATRESRHWTSSVLLTISSFGPVSPCLLKRLRMTPVRCSSTLSINFMVARQIIERWSCWARHQYGMARTVQPSSRKAELGRAPFTKPSTSS